MNDGGVVYVVDDDPGVRSGLRLLFASVRLSVAGFDSAEAFLSSYDKSRPGVLVLDVRMPGMGGLDLLDQIVAEDLPIPVIILTGHGDVAMAVRALKRGALEFIQKPGNEQSLLDLVQDAMAANVRCLTARTQQCELLGRFDSLSQREREVALRIAEGMPNRKVAEELAISARTVETHRMNAMRKLGVHVATDLVHVVESAQAGMLRRCASGQGLCPACRLMR